MGMGRSGAVPAAPWGAARPRSAERAGGRVTAAAERDGWVCVCVRVRVRVREQRGACDGVAFRHGWEGARELERLSAERV